MQVYLLMGRRGEQRGEYLQTNPIKKFKTFVNSLLKNSINLFRRPTKIKWKYTPSLGNVSLIFPSE